MLFSVPALIVRAPTSVPAAGSALTKVGGLFRKFRSRVPRYNPPIVSLVPAGNAALITGEPNGALFEFSAPFVLSVPMIALVLKPPDAWGTNATQLPELTVHQLLALFQSLLVSP